MKSLGGRPARDTDLWFCLHIYIYIYIYICGWFRGGADHVVIVIGESGSHQEHEEAEPAQKD